jgi:hypothetical protein
MRFFVSALLIFGFIFLFAPSFVVASSILDVPFLPQVPPGNWSDTRNCGQSSYLMVQSFYKNNPVSESDIKSVDDWLKSEFNDDIRNYSGNYTNISKLIKIARQFGGFEDFSILSGTQNIDLLKNHISEGNPVIVAVYTNMFLKGNMDVPHFMVLTGVDDEFVYVNDPGKSKGKNNQYNIADFLNAWKKQNYSAVVIIDGEDGPSLPPTPQPPQQPDAPTSSQPLPWYQKIFNWFQNAFEYVVGQVAGDTEETQESQAEVPPSQEPSTAPVVSTWEAQYVDQSPYPSLETGKTAVLKVRFRNAGTTTWNQGDVSLNIVSSGNSPLYHSSWITQKRPARLAQKTVAPGQVGEFVFTIKAPSAPGVYRLAVRPVFQQGNNFQWLGKDFGVYWLITAQSPAQSQVDQLDNISESSQPMPSQPPSLVAPQISGTDSNTNVAVGEFPSGVTPPVITLPSAESSMWYLSTSIVTFGGTKSATTTSIIIIHNDTISEITSFADANSWQSLISLVEGENHLEVIAVDQGGNLSVADSLLITVDGVAPDAPSIVAGKLSSSSVQIVVNPAEASLSYDIRYGISTITHDNWDTASSTSQVFMADSTTSTQSFIINELENISQLKFYARVRDQAGNWSGISASSSIKNITPLGMLRGFAITPDSLNIQWSVPHLQVIADNPVFEVYFSTSTLTDANIAQATRVVLPRTPRTSIFGTREFVQLNDLQSSTTYYIAARYSDGANFSDFVYGNFTTTENHSTITDCSGCYFKEDVLFSKENSPYIITGDAFVFPEISLTIEPGVVIKFNHGAEITMFGELVARGTADEPIVFTSILDDEYGGDTNGDGAASSPGVGDWIGVYVDSLEGEPATLDHVIMRYGGDDDPMLTIGLNADVSISNSEFSYAQEMAVHLLGIDQTIRVENNRFHNNSRAMLIDFTADTKITHNDFRNNRYHTEDYFYDSGALAIYYGDESNLLISDNNFINNSFWGFTLDEGQSATLTNNYFGSSDGPLIIDYNEIWDNPNGYDDRGVRDLVTEGIDYSNFSPTEHIF